MRLFDKIYSGRFPWFAIVADVFLFGVFIFSFFLSWGYPLAGWHRDVFWIAHGTRFFVLGMEIGATAERLSPRD